jgi:hypothetical protein
MASPSVRPGLGTSLKQGSTAISQSVSIEGPNLSVGAADKTSLSDTRKRKRPTIPDAGDVTLKVWLVLTGLWANPNTVPWTITFMDGAADPTTHQPTAGSTVTFNAFLTAFGVTGVEIESNLEADVTLTIDGDVTITAASA